MARILFVAIVVGAAHGLVLGGVGALASGSLEASRPTDCRLATVRLSTVDYFARSRTAGILCRRRSSTAVGLTLPDRVERADAVSLRIVDGSARVAERARRQHFHFRGCPRKRRRGAVEKSLPVGDHRRFPAHDTFTAKEHRFVRDAARRTPRDCGRPSISRTRSPPRGPDRRGSPRRAARARRERHDRDAAEPAASLVHRECFQHGCPCQRPASCDCRLCDCRRSTSLESPALPASSSAGLHRNHTSSADDRHGKKPADDGEEQIQIHHRPAGESRNRERARSSSASRRGR